MLALCRFLCICSIGLMIGGLYISGGVALAGLTGVVVFGFLWGAKSVDG
jgi:hypothetical protein